MIVLVRIIFAQVSNTFNPSKAKTLMGASISGKLIFSKISFAIILTSAPLSTIAQAFTTLFNSIASQYHRANYKRKKHRSDHQKKEKSALAYLKKLHPPF